MLAGNLPSVDAVHAAIAIYLHHAYGTEPRPRHVIRLLDQLRSTDDGTFFLAPVWESDGLQPPARLAIRLGNRAYPHMKLTLERRPDGLGYLFRADPHCQHVFAPLPVVDHGKFEELVAFDQQIARDIECAWAEHGLPTIAEKHLANVLPSFMAAAFMQA